MKLVQLGVEIFWVYLPAVMLELRSCFQRLQRRGIVFIRNIPGWHGIFNKIGLRKLVLLCVGLFIMFGIYTIWTGGTSPQQLDLLLMLLLFTVLQFQFVKF